ncbi:asparaginyl-tRNA synthetase [Fervidicoccus fontis Kam940]|uniref:Asparagine--tRNA ligase n=2 Tax=Fervidicoccus fontis TaxID=683846 RepID=I0A314_FERFK|nr:asparaginyl-tRNA synthetase [Fervidicoccus fontis Kam940]
MEDGSEVSIRGWIHRKFQVGKKIFIRVRDSSGVIQCVIEEGVVGKEKFNEFEGAKRESSVVVSGKLRTDERAPGGKEMYVSEGKVVGFADDFPIKGYEGVEFLLDNRHLWLRSTYLTNVMKVKHTALKLLREFHTQEGWWEVTPPIITSSAVEGGATLFKVDYFGEPAYLSQSAQFYLEVLIYSLEKVFALTPSFRAEKSRTRRHLSEYYHFEIEGAWMDMEELMKFTERTVEYVVQNLIDERQKELEDLGRDIESLKRVKAPFERITYTKAIEFLKQNGVNIEWGNDYGADEEAMLTKLFDRPFFVTHFPKTIKPFYMKVDENDERVVKGFDLLAPEGYGEIIGGSQREDSYDVLLKRIVEQGYDPKDYYWYLDLRKYGSVPHSGYGLGIERLVMWVAGLEHIRDAIPFPRFRERSKP